MITTYPPPPGPRVELLRVRRRDSSTRSERSGPPPLREVKDPSPPKPQRMEHVEISDEALRLLIRDLELQASEKPS